MINRYISLYPNIENNNPIKGFFTRPAIILSSENHTTASKDYNLQSEDCN
jgi:hypothetical protein